MLSPALPRCRRIALPQHGARRADNVARRGISERGVAVKLDVIEGIGSKHTSALSRAGVTHVRHLLQRGATPSGREALARETGLSSSQLLEWVNHIDLMRIRGVGAEYSDLLEAAGVDSPDRARTAQPGAARSTARRDQRAASARAPRTVGEGARELDLGCAYAAAADHPLTGAAHGRARLRRIRVPPRLGSRARARARDRARRRRCTSTCSWPAPARCTKTRRSRRARSTSTRSTTSPGLSTSRARSPATRSRSRSSRSRRVTGAGA